MAIADVVTMGYGSFSRVTRIPTLGYETGVSASVVPCKTRFRRLPVSEDERMRRAAEEGDVRLRVAAGAADDRQRRTTSECL